MANILEDSLVPEYKKSTAGNASSGKDAGETVGEDLPIGTPELIRRKNNARRDARTNLGRGISVTPVSKHK